MEIGVATVSVWRFAPVGFAHEEDELSGLCGDARYVCEFAFIALVGGGHSCIQDHRDWVPMQRARILLHPGIAVDVDIERVVVCTLD